MYLVAALKIDFLAVINLKGQSCAQERSVVGSYGALFFFAQICNFEFMNLWKTFHFFRWHYYTPVDNCCKDKFSNLFVDNLIFPSKNPRVKRLNFDFKRSADQIANISTPKKYATSISKLRPIYTIKINFPVSPPVIPALHAIS